MQATRRQPLAQLDLGAVVRTYAENPSDDGGGDVGLVARPDLVVAEVRRTPTGWEVYGRPASRPDSGPRTRAKVTGGEVDVVARDEELAAIRTVLADYLGRRPVRVDDTTGGDRPSPEVAVAGIDRDGLALIVYVRGVAWRVVV